MRAELAEKDEQQKQEEMEKEEAMLKLNKAQAICSSLETEKTEIE